MMTCWLFGHRYEYELKHGGDLSLICTKCGHWRVLVEVKAEKNVDVIFRVKP